LQKVPGATGIAPKISPRLVGRNAEPAPAKTIIPPEQLEESAMNGIIYLVGLVVVVGAILSFLGLH
jgi:hypothetical protein